jgi:hypothetical protein
VALVWRFARTYQEKIRDCDLELRRHLESLGSKVDLDGQPLGPKPKGKKSGRNSPQFDLRTELYRITGIDWAQVNGMDVVTAQTVIAECGADLRAFPSEKQFTSWLGLILTNEQSGGKILKRRTRKVVNRAAMAFRNAANTLLRSQSYLGAISPAAHPSRRSQSHHRHGAQARLPVLPTHQTRPSSMWTKG